MVNSYDGQGYKKQKLANSVIYQNECIEHAYCQTKETRFKIISTTIPYVKVQNSVKPKIDVNFFVRACGGMHCIRELIIFYLQLLPCA